MVPGVCAERAGLRPGAPCRVWSSPTRPAAAAYARRADGERSRSRAPAAARRAAPAKLAARDRVIGSRTRRARTRVKPAEREYQEGIHRPMSERSRAIVARDREQRAWALVCAGRSQVEIAQELGVQQPAVSKLLRRLSLRVMQQLGEQVLEYKGQQHARLEHIYAEAMRGWERSQQPQK